MENKENLIVQTERLLDLFKELEKVLKKEAELIGVNPKKSVFDLIKDLRKTNSVLVKYKNELEFVRDIRNVVTHEKVKNDKYVVYPSAEINKMFERIIEELKTPPLIIESKMCIKIQKICYKSMEDSVADTIKEMSEKLYTHIPILDNGALKGVFSENTLLDIVNTEGGIIVDKNTKFKEIEEELKLVNHSMEDFKFISKNKTVYDVYELFKNYFSQRKRLGCVYITENGYPTEKLLGMVTAWDVLGSEK